MKLLDKIREHAANMPENMAIADYHGQSFTYGQLEQYSNRIAAYLQEHIPADGSPVIVYGHKELYLPIIFLGCVKAGHPYCPIDSSEADERIRMIIDEVKPHIVFAAGPLGADQDNVLSLEQVKDICLSESFSDGKDGGTQENDIFILLFTSGSTGRPKGVEVKQSNIDDFFIWFEIWSAEYQEDFVFLNQLAYTFDLSMLELYAPLWIGGSAYIIDSMVQKDFKRMLNALGDSNAVSSMSTPYLAELCLLSKAFSEKLMPRLRLILLCGEVLENATALKLIDRFPAAKIVNMYGPTEATIAVTEQEITKELAEKPDPLPIGKPRSRTEIEIWNENGEVARTGETGEIVIKGDSVTKGYFRQKEMTEKVFIPYEEDGRKKAAYRTGDCGFIDADGIVHCRGRIDMQVQFHGYRIELPEIEKTLLKLELVSKAVVLPKWDGGKVKYLAAFMIAADEAQGEKTPEELGKLIREELKGFLPEYMIPKRIICSDSLPMNKSGKVDRKKLAESL